MKIDHARVQRFLFTLCLFIIVVWWAAIFVSLNRDQSDPIKLDFIAFWAAAKLALAGEPLSVWNPGLFEIAQGIRSAEKGTMPWFYPPTFQLALAPLGFLPLTLAYGAFIALSLVFYFRLISRIIPDYAGYLVAAPAVILCCFLGNNAVFFAACLGYALLHLTQPARAGFSIALMSMKPTLGPMIPIALLASRRWGVILWASLFVVGMAAAATLLFGIAYWTAFIDASQTALGRIKPGSHETGMMVSWFSLARTAGWSQEAAIGLHGAWLIAMIAALILLWARSATDFNWQAAALFLAVPLTSPHAFHYEMTYGLLALGFMLRAGIGPIGKVIAVTLWLGPLPGIWSTTLFPLVSFAAPVLSIAFVYAVVRGLRG
ncbi:MAG: glycosyltransferase family 87 protein [Pseudomonadota bacterium]